MNQTYSNTMLFYPQLELYSLNYSDNFIDDVYYDFEPVFPDFFKEAIKRINVASVSEVILACSLFITTLWLFYVYTVTIPRLQSLARWTPAVKLVKEQQTTTTEDTLLTRQIEYDAQLNLHDFIQQFEALGGTYSQLRGWTIKKFIRKTGGRKGKPYFLYYNRRGKEFRSLKRIVELFDI